MGRSTPSVQFVCQHLGHLPSRTAKTGRGHHLPQLGSGLRVSPRTIFEILFAISPSGARALSVRILNSFSGKVQNTTHFNSKLYCVHPIRGNTKSGTAGVPARITTARGTEEPENWTSRQPYSGPSFFLCRVIG